MNISRIAILSSVAILALSPSYVAAQTETEQATDANEIVVTARRQNEKLQDVPASVTVLTAEAIVNTGARVAADYIQLTPGVTIVAGGVEAGDTQISIRGINGSRDAENNVALVVDGILKSNTALLSQDQGALTQIEVLKGPQGAYYGRNAAAGAIVITTKKPGTELEVSGRATAGNNASYSGAVLVSGPIGGSAGFVINADYAKSDGFYRDAFLSSAQSGTLFPNGSREGKSVDDFERYNINGRLIFNVGDATELDLKARYGKSKSAAISFNAVFQLPGLAAAFNAPVFNINVDDHEFLFTRNVDPENNQETFEGSLRLTHEFNDNLTLTAYGAYSDVKNDFFADGTSGTFSFFNNESNCIASAAALRNSAVQAPFGIDLGNPAVFLPPYSPTTCDGTQYQQRDQEDYSAEVRIAGDFVGVQLLAGGYYLHINRRTCLNLGLDTGRGVIRECFTTDARNPTEALTDDSFKTDVYALFGSAEYKPLENLTLSAALRYDIEQRDTSNNIPTGRRTRWVGNVLTGNPNGTATTPANYFLNPALDPAYNPSGVLGPRSATFKQLQPKIAISYEPSSTLTVYANWGVGFKTGGFNNGGSEAIVNNFFNATIDSGLSIFDTYRKETSSAFEAGVKGSVAPGINFELAGYYTDVKDSQFFEFFVGPFGLLRVVSNIDKVVFKGVEASFDARITDGWTVFGSANYTDSEIKRNRARPYTVGNKAPYTAEYTLNIGTQKIGPLTDSVNYLLRADYRVTGPTFFHTVQDNTVPTIFGLDGNFANSRREAFGILNLRAGLKAERWSLIAFAANLTDRRFLGEVIPAPEFGGDFISPGARRSYGLEASFNF